MSTIVLGIETSCDETAAAVVAGDRTIHANLVLSQMADHAPYGGVVPEIAARSHIDHLDRLVVDALAAAGIEFSDLDAVAATAGPGLIGGVIVGLMTAKAIAAVIDRPLIAVNHLEGHALTPRLIGDLPFPYLLLLVSGGHCQLLSVDGVGRYRRLGTTIDDAVGEAFDKTAKLLDLGYPGGPAIEHWAESGDPRRFVLPRPLRGRPGCHFSFSGLKTAVRHAIQVKLAKEFLADPRHHLVVAIDDGEIVGFVSGVHYVHPDKPAELFINEVGVAATHQREGIATKLLDELLGKGRTLGCREAWVATEPDNQAARRLAASCRAVPASQPFFPALARFACAGSLPSDTSTVRPPYSASIAMSNATARSRTVALLSAGGPVNVTSSFMEPPRSTRPDCP